MHPTELIAETTTPGGNAMTLVRQSGALMVLVDGNILMSSRLHGSEDVLGQLAGERLTGKRHQRVLVGGLGMGFTLRAALDSLPPTAAVTVAELVPALVEWNRGPLGPLAKNPLEDKRVQLVVDDVAAVLQRASKSYDAVLLDVDNGPEDLTMPDNDWLYSYAGLAIIREALAPGGMVVVWSAFSDKAFETRMAAVGLQTEVLPVRARGKVAKGARHVLYVGTRAGPKPGSPGSGRRGPSKKGTGSKSGGSKGSGGKSGGSKGPRRR